MTQFLELPHGWDPALASEIRRTGSYRRRDGVRVPVYNYLFDGSSAAERIFRALLTQVTNFENGRLRENGYAFTLHEAEVATNFLSEGGDRPIAAGDPAAFFSGAGSLGIDTFMDEYPNLKRWLPRKVIQLVEACSVAEIERALERELTGFEKDFVTAPTQRCYAPGVRGTGLFTTPFTNELRTTYYTLDLIDMDIGMYANAAMFVAALARAARDIPSFAELGREARFFWGTVYFNSGASNARKLFQKHGVDYYRQELMPTRVPAMSAQYHAIKRVSSMGFLLRTVYAR
jgi:hypothetical protein